MMEEVHKRNGTKRERALSETCGTVTLHTTIMIHCTVDSSAHLYIKLIHTASFSVINSVVFTCKFTVQIHMH